MGFNSAQIGDGNITNVVIKSRYALLDLKCNKLEKNLKKFLREIIEVILNDLNKKDGTDYQQKDVYFDFEREIITNELDNANIKKTKADIRKVEIDILLGLKGVIDDETIIKSICEQLDIDYDDIKDKLPVNEVNNTLNAIDTLGGINE